MLSVDCEMVGVGPEGAHDCLARVAVCNERGEPLYFRHVIPTEEVRSSFAHPCLRPFCPRLEPSGHTCVTPVSRLKACPQVVDYRAHITGLHRDRLTKQSGAVTFEEAQQKVADLLRVRVHITTQKHGFVHVL